MNPECLQPRKLRDIGYLKAQCCQNEVTFKREIINELPPYFSHLRLYLLELRAFLFSEVIENTPNDPIVKSGVLDRPHNYHHCVSEIQRIHSQTLATLNP